MLSSPAVCNMPDKFSYNLVDNRFSNTNLDFVCRGLIAEEHQSSLVFSISADSGKKVTHNLL
jgi:hypothetical protein